MRITGGTLRGRVLRTLSGHAVRPTSDKVRQALFNILGDAVEGVRVLDVFAGSGSVGLEALSRGAEHVTFVEKDHRALKVIHENVVNLGMTDAATVRRFDIARHPDKLRDPAGTFDLVFLDPPYRMTRSVAPGTELGRLLEALWSEEIVAVDGTCVLEHDRRATLSRQWQHFRIRDARTWGDTTLTFLDAEES